MSVPKTPVKKNLVPFQQQSLATNQQAIPLAYLAGTRVMAVQWISPALNQVTQQVANGGKKG